MNSHELSIQMQETISNVLGREILRSEFGSVNGVDEFTESDLKDLRTIYGCNIVLAIAFAMHKLGDSVEVAKVVSFVRLVAGEEDSLK